MDVININSLAFVFLSINEVEYVKLYIMTLPGVPLFPYLVNNSRLDLN